MLDEDVFEEYGDTPLHFSHYYNFVFIYKSTKFDDGSQIFLKLGGNMEKVSLMVVDVEEPLTLNEKGDDEYAYIKSEENQQLWEHGEPL